MGSKSKPILIDLNLEGAVTSITCGHIVVELIKFIAYNTINLTCLLRELRTRHVRLIILYQRLQIPYTYQWLKQIVSKRKLCEDELKPLSFQSQSHFHNVSTSLDNLDFILKSIFLEINGCCMPQEVCIALGGTPVAFKEVYRLLLPSIYHRPQCHTAQVSSDQKIQRSVFRALVTSEKLSGLFTSPLPPTNLYLLVKKKVMSFSNISCTDNFVHTNGYWIPKSSKIVVLNLNSPSGESGSCCNELQVFGDIRNDLENLKISDNKKLEQFYEIESTDEEKWYQSTYVMRGFKDCFVNGSSVMNSWTD